MSLSTSASHTLLSVPSSICRSCRLRLRRTQLSAPLHSRTYASAPTQANSIKLANASGQKSDDNAQNIPRWAATPPAMRAPFRLRPKNDNDEFPVNEDPKRLDQAYARFLGNDGPEMLPEEVKWLAVTHKSFDHGRRGFNDRLAFLGRRIVTLQTSLALLNKPRKKPASSSSSPSSSPNPAEPKKDHYDREIYTHPALDGIENIMQMSRNDVLGFTRLAKLAENAGLADVIRWKPRQIRDLKASGIDSVMVHTMYAIIGAIALQRGGEVANTTVRQRILNPLGVI